MNLSNQRFRFNHLNITCFLFSFLPRSVLSSILCRGTHLSSVTTQMLPVCFFDVLPQRVFLVFFLEEKRHGWWFHNLVSNYCYTCTTSEPCFNWKGPSFGAETSSRYCIYLYLSLFRGGSIHENPNILLDLLDQKSSNVIPTLIKWYS